MSWSQFSYKNTLLRLISIGIIITLLVSSLSLFATIPASATNHFPASLMNVDTMSGIHPVYSLQSEIHQFRFIHSQETTGILQVLHSFNGTDGGGPNSLIQATSGLFYGTTANGGDTGSCAPDGCGIIFTLSSTGSFTILHVFHATDGYLPMGLIQGSDGNFYGTTIAGGQPSGGGAGTFFRLSPDGLFTTLYSFVGGFACCDGGSPVGIPIQASDGKYYGVTSAGGQFRDVDHPGGFGTFYQFNPTTGSLTILHSFNISDGNGIFPSGSLVQGTDGFLYGVTREGGLGGGTIFKLDTAGNITLLHSITDSAQPLAGLFQATDGFFYGTTDGGAGAGTVFRIDSAGNYNVVNVFDGGDGFRPHVGLMQANDGFIYGTTPQGGLLDFQAGSLFKINGSGSLAVLHSFTQSDPVTGIIPNSVLIQGNDGSIYGTAGIGGTGLHGTIFRFNPALQGPVLSITVIPSTIITPGSATGTITLSNPAPQGGTLVDLRVTSFNVVVPLTITVPAGMTESSFTLHAALVNQPELVRLYASVTGEGIRTTFTILPPGPTPTPTVFHTPTPTLTQIPPTQTLPAPSPTFTSTSSPTATPTMIPSPSPTPTSTLLPNPSPTPTSTGIIIPSPTPTSTGIPNPLPTSTPTVLPFPSPTPTSVGFPLPTPTSTSIGIPNTTPTPMSTGIPPGRSIYKIFLPLTDFSPVKSP